MTLSALLTDPTVKARVIADCVHLIDHQVAAKGGLGGLALKTAYGVVNGISAGYVPGAIERLLPEVLPALNPLWTEGLQTGDPVAFLQQNSDRAAEAILGVTDARIAGADNGLIKSSYTKLRRSVQPDVAAAIPELASILGRHSTVASEA